MKTLEFRAWDGKTEMYYFTLSDVMTSKINFTDEKWKVTQYIGITDANGRKIFKGDILDTIDNGTAYYPNRIVVEYHGMCFMFIGKTKGASSFTEYTSSSIQAQDITQCDYVEIIGNIYENPDLTLNL